MLATVAMRITEVHQHEGAIGPELRAVTVVDYDVSQFLARREMAPPADRAAMSPLTYANQSPAIATRFRVESRQARHRGLSLYRLVLPRP